MSDCKICKAIEPYDNETIFHCDCHKTEMTNIDNVLKEIEENFESLWEANTCAVS